MNHLFEKLQPYPFEKLAKLLEDCNKNPKLDFITLTVGEPQHATPAVITNAITENLEKYRYYPTTAGLPELRQTIAKWIERRFNLAPEAINFNSQIIPVAGTREALFSFARAVVNEQDKRPLVLMPNPFYQIYEGAAFFAGAETYFLNAGYENQYQIDLDKVPAKIWDRCQLIYVCTPGNPSGAVMPKKQQEQLLNLAQQYNFVIAADECYSEIYRHEAAPPQGFLQTCNEMGNNSFKNCVVFHSLSKRSNSPGLRSGFVAGDADILKKYLQYRTYHGANLPVPTQLASIAAWSDEEHVKMNRALYREKFNQVEKILSGKLNFSSPTAGFYLWPQVEDDDLEFTKRLYQQQSVGVLPGSLLSRQTKKENPGYGHIRIALVAELADCVQAAQRIVNSF